MVLCKFILVYISGGPETEVRAEAEKVADIGMKVLLSLIGAFLESLSLLVAAELQQIFYLTI